METARHWRLNNQRYKLQGSMCIDCGKKYFPPREDCTVCIDNERGDIYIANRQIDTLTKNQQEINK